MPTSLPDIPPGSALSPREWKEEHVIAQPGNIFAKIVELPNGKTALRVIPPGSSIDLDNPHGVAALCLYGQPFGFTREDVELLRHFAGTQMSPEALSLAFRINLLLPPTS